MVELLVVLVVAALVGAVIWQRHRWNLAIDRSLAEAALRQDPRIDRTRCSACGKIAGWSPARPNSRYTIDPRLYDCRSCGMRWDVSLYPPVEGRNEG